MTSTAAKCFSASKTSRSSQNHQLLIVPLALPSFMTYYPVNKLFAHIVKCRNRNYSRNKRAPIRVDNVHCLLFCKEIEVNYNITLRNQLQLTLLFLIFVKLFWNSWSAECRHRYYWMLFFDFRKSDTNPSSFSIFIFSISLCFVLLLLFTRWLLW